MSEEKEDILDYNPKSNRNVRLVNILYGISFLLFAYWYIAEIKHWPYIGIALFLGLFILLAIILIRFISKPTRAPFEYAYFLGKLTLIGAVYISFMNLPYAYQIIFTSFGFFLLGMILLSVQRHKK